eukprot:763887-Hanusia_phi.AAC.1
MVTLDPPPAPPWLGDTLMSLACRTYSNLRPPGSFCPLGRRTCTETVEGTDGGRLHATDDSSGDDTFNCPLLLESPNTHSHSPIPS